MSPRTPENSEVIIVNSPLFEDTVEGYDEDSLPPIGLGYIATSLQEAGIETCLIDAVADNIPVTNLIQTMNASVAKVLAMNVFTTNLHLVKRIVEESHIPRVIIGGLSTRSLYKEIFSWNTDAQIDVVMGDGERITADLINNVEYQEPHTRERNRRYYFVDATSPYYMHDISNLPLNREFFTNDPVLQKTHNVHESSIVASRGCLYNCGFCAAARSQNSHATIRERSIEDVSREIGELKDRYASLQSIRVLDDLFLKNPRSIEKAAAMFRGHYLRWRAMAHVMSFKNVTDEQLKELADSGCNELFIGIESGSPQVLKGIHKTSDTELIKHTIARIMKAGISVKGYFIYGFPGETEHDCSLTYALAEELKTLSFNTPGHFRTSVFRYRPYHGTEIYQNLEMDGRTFTVNRDMQLTHVQDRQQFNFFVENFSSCPEERITDFITKTDALNAL